MPPRKVLREDLHEHSHEKIITYQLKFYQVIYKHNNMNTLAEEKCIPCEGDVSPLTAQEISKLLPEVTGWQEEDNTKIWREFVFKNFVQAVDFINRIADVAEYEDHHPDILLHDYKYVRVELVTHAIKGLSRNDFVVAARINEIA